MRSSPSLYVLEERPMLFGRRKSDIVFCYSVSTLSGYLSIRDDKWRTFGALTAILTVSQAICNMTEEWETQDTYILGNDS
jgi:hypothetical protein